MARSNSPLALSVVATTILGDPVATSKEIMRFDGKSIGFTHDKTWASMPAALRGVIKPDSVASTLENLHPRVAAAISTLCRIGALEPKNTFSLRDYPNAGLKEVLGLRVSEDCIIRAKASCWFVENGNPIIPLLQPRKSGLTVEQMSMYMALGRRAFCNGDWANAAIQTIDLCGESGSYAIYTEGDLPIVSDEMLHLLVSTYVEGLALATAAREADPNYGKIRRTRKTDAQPTFDF